jgi:hypothetical protein
LPGPPPGIGIIIGSVPEPSSDIELALGALLVLGLLGWRNVSGRVRRGSSLAPPLPGEPCSS